MWLSALTDAEKMNVHKRDCFLSLPGTVKERAYRVSSMSFIHTGTEEGGENFHLGCGSVNKKIKNKKST